METIVRHRDEGKATWFLNSLVTTKLTAAETGGIYNVTEHLMTAAANPPMHMQTAEEEAFLMLDGEVEFELDGVITCCYPGSLALVPRGVAHTFRVLTPTARMMVIASSSEPAPSGGLENFFTAAGVPASARVLPVATAPDPVVISTVAAAHGIEILPPA